MTSYLTSRLTTWSGLTTALLFLLMISCQTPTKRAVDTAKDEVSEGKLVLVDLNNSVIELASDKILILNLWATWCKPCIEEMPSLIAMSEQLPDSYELILASDEDPDRINKFLSTRNLNARFARLKSAMDALGIYSLPTTLVINGKGEILETLVGAREWNTQEQIDQITAFKP